MKREMINKKRMNSFKGVKSVIKAESDFDPNVQSSKGAQGLMQLIPSTAKLVGCDDSFDARQNIQTGEEGKFSAVGSRFNEWLATYTLTPQKYLLFVNQCYLVAQKDNSIVSGIVKLAAKGAEEVTSWKWVKKAMNSKIVKWAQEEVGDN